MLIKKRELAEGQLSEGRETRQTTSAARADKSRHTRGRNPSTQELGFQCIVLILQGVPLRVALDFHRLHDFPRGAPECLIGFQWIHVHLGRTASYDFIGFQQIYIHFARGTLGISLDSTGFAATFIEALSQGNNLKSDRIYVYRAVSCKGYTLEFN